MSLNILNTCYGGGPPFCLLDLSSGGAGYATHTLILEGQKKRFPMNNATKNMSPQK